MPKPVSLPPRLVIRKREDKSIDETKRDENIQRVELWNSRFERFKLFIVVPLELATSISFLLVVLIFGARILCANWEKPENAAVGFLKQIHEHWIGAVVIIGLLLYRPILKKFEDLRSINENIKFGKDAK